MCMLAGNYNKVKCEINGCKMKVQWVEGVFGNGEVQWIEGGGNTGKKVKFRANEFSRIAAVNFKY